MVIRTTRETNQAYTPYCVSNDVDDDLIIHPSPFLQKLACLGTQLVSLRRLKTQTKTTHCHTQVSVSLLRIDVYKRKQNPLIVTHKYQTPLAADCFFLFSFKYTRITLAKMEQARMTEEKKKEKIPYCRKLL
jgi:hypothetical protein